MAQAGIKRLNLSQYIKEVFPLDYITPPAGQGALAVVARKDYDKKDKIAKLNDYISMQEVLAEKKVLEELGVGCQWPIGSIAQMKDKELNVYSILLTQKGEILKEQTEKGSVKDALELGRRIGRIFADYV
jgi:hydroxymethylbilane synthase